MAHYAPTTSGWTAVSATGQGQVRTGRILWAATNAPTNGDWLVLPEGAVIAVLNAGYVKAFDPGATFSVVAI